MDKKQNKLRDKSIFIVILIVLLVALIMSIIFAVAMGSMEISAKDILKVVCFKVFGVGDATIYGKGAMPDVVWFIRLPRLMLAVAVGMALSVSGTVMQAIVKNPLADPYILGVSSGASLGATLAIMLGIGTALGSNFIGIMGCLGALGVSFMVMMLSNIGGRSNSVKLLLSGMALSAVCSAFSSFIVYFANNKEGMMSITYWLMGSLAGAKWDSVKYVLPFIIICSIFFWSQYRVLNLMLLGDEVSITLGTDLTKYRHIYLIITSTMIGFVVYTSGMIGFVGLVIPHIVRSVVGTNHEKLIPISALLGAILMVWADVLCRTIVPNSEIPIGILTSMIGAPCFVYMMIKKSYGFGGAN